LVARRLIDWGARTCLAPDEHSAISLLRERTWSAVLVDHALGSEACERLAGATAAISRRVVLITPAERHQIAVLKQVGFTGYLVKPVRAVTLAAQMAAADDGLDHSGQEARQAEAKEGERATHGLAVLVAEDNEVNALLAQALLTRLGHRATLVATGDAAVKAWLAAQAAGDLFDLLLMDLQMPGGDGIAAARAIRAMEREQGGRRLPIFALTANAFDEDRAASQAAGMDGFLVKPLDRRQLLNVLARISAAATLAA
jgi:CheY-like chemotaxis protein